MNRKLQCRTCGEAASKRGLHPEDRAQGWKIRTRYVQTGKTPDNHGLRLNGVFSKLPNIVCDTCGATINQSVVVATTMWLKEKEQQPRFWEEEFGTILSPEVVAAIDKLTDNQPKKGQT